MKIVALVFTLIASILLAGAAGAQDVQVSVNGPGAPSTSYFFEIPAAPSPDVVDPGDTYFVLNDVTYQQGGFSPCPCVGSVTFYASNPADPDFDGGLAIGEASYTGAQLFTGPVSDPVLSPGTFDVIYHGPSFYNGQPGTITISAVAGAVPEPLTWGMMVSGFALVGGALRRGRSVLPVA